MKARVGTISGKLVDVLNPNPDTIIIEDIAWSLAREGRYSNFTQDKYSVAQHSVLVARCLPPHLAMQGLLHDASEAYLRDIPAEVKRSLLGYQEIEASLTAVILQKFGCDPVLDPLVKEMDDQVFRMEIDQIYTPHFREMFWPDVPRSRLSGYVMCAWDDDESRELFMQAFGLIQAGRPLHQLKAI